MERSLWELWERSEEWMNCSFYSLWLLNVMWWWWWRTDVEIISHIHIQTIIIDLSKKLQIYNWACDWWSFELDPH